MNSQQAQTKRRTTVDVAREQLLYRYFELCVRDELLGKVIAVAIDVGLTPDQFRSRITSRKSKTPLSTPLLITMERHLKQISRSYFMVYLCDLHQDDEIELGEPTRWES